MATEVAGQLVTDQKLKYLFKDFSEECKLVAYIGVGSEFTFLME